MDMISSLPDGIISHILSFLPIKKAAQTSVLSKRWCVQFSFSPYLDLSDYYWDSLKSLKGFLDRVLALSGNSPIKKFSLRCEECIDPAHINRWINDVLNQGVLDLYLDADISCISLFSLAFEIFTCTTLVKLKLIGFSNDVLPEDAFLPALKTLSTNTLHLCAFEKLLSVFPMVVDFSIYDLNWEYWKCSRMVSTATLERLTFGRSDLSGFVVSLDSLVEANLKLLDHAWYERFVDENGHITCNPTNLIKGLRNVKIINFLYPGSLEMFHIFRKAIPVYKNLFQLSIRTVSDCDCWRGLQFLLNNSPNLETFIIKGSVHYDKFGIDLSLCECLSEYSFLLPCPVKVLKITEYDGTTEELEHMTHS